ncbi:phenylcoumaran benzylic ether reductase Betv6-like [Tripterygium wilfordii]|uniref:phenylcoumaran benzylic ether reductase Betv6-like n=1 Tax=Tripterygium wilfordii TaxID=458696 RepID=UPI0018F803FB|nr:phenylcoumaran benzylic ether reductase Betv6-like [Tripterygium wilfordii]
MAEISKVLVIGGTGYIGKHVVEESAKSGHPTFALVRESSVSDPVKGKLIENFKSLGVTILIGDINDHESLLAAVKKVDIVISTVGHMQIPDQINIITAIKEAGNVKRFLPSEFGNDVDHLHSVEPLTSGFARKTKLRRTIEAEGIPYTYLCCNFFAGYFLPTLCQVGVRAPPRDKVNILGDGNVKAVFNEENAIAKFTIKVINDPKTLNKIVYIRPPLNTYSLNELVALWEKLIGQTLEKTYVSEEELLKQIEATPPPFNLLLALNHSVFIKGDHTNFEIDPAVGFEATEIYPDVEYTTVEEYLKRFV